MTPPVSIGALRKLLKELQASARDEKPLAVGGARELARGPPARARPRRRRRARFGRRRPGGRAAYIYVLGREPTERGRAGAEARAPRARPDRRRRRRPGGRGRLDSVRARDRRRSRPRGRGLPARGDRARDRGDGSARRARRSRRGCRCYAARSASGSSRRSPGRTGSSPRPCSSPAPTCPCSRCNQVRLLLRLDQAYGLELDPREPRARGARRRSAAGLGLRTVARELLDLVPVAGWAVKGAVAYAGTRALGEAAIRRLEVGVPGGHGSSRPD